MSREITLLTGSPHKRLGETFEQRVRVPTALWGTLLKGNVDF